MSLEIDSPEAVEDNQRAVSPQSRSKKKKLPVEVFQIRTYKQQLPLPPPQTEGSGAESLSTRSSTSKQVAQRLFKTNSKEVIFYSDTMLVTSMEETCEAIDDTQRKLDEAKSILTTALEKNTDIMSPGSLERRKSLSQVIAEADAHEKEEERNNTLSVHIDNNEVLMGQERLLKSLELPSLYVRNLNKRICEALKQSLVYLVVYAFAIVDEKIMYCGVAPQTQENIFPVPYAYEMTKNDYLPQHITKDQLLDEMTHFQENYKLVLAICKFLETGAETQYHYIIYKRPIDYYGKEIADSKTSISARLFNMKKTGFYYAIRINFGLTEPADKFPI